MGKKFTFIAGLVFLATSSALAQEYVPGEVIVKFKDQTQGQANFSNKAMGLGVKLKRSWGKLNTHQFQAKAGNQNVEQLVLQLKQDPNVEYAEPNYILKMQSSGQDGEAVSMSEFRALRSSSISAASTESASSAVYDQSNAPVQVDEAWQVMKASSSRVPVVAVIDSGVDYNHDVFVDSDAIWTNSGETPNDGIDNDNNGYVDDVRGWDFINNDNSPMDDNNHGTHVAGIVLGVTQDIRAATITPAIIKIMPLKFLSDTGTGSTSDAIEAIYYAIDNGATIINASWGGGGYSTALLSAITEAYNNQISFVAAAGNAHLNNDNNPTYPANYDVDNILSIAATTDYDAMTSFTNFGKQTVHVASPGYQIWSTLRNNSAGRYSGTSMATPFVAGMIALMEREVGAAINGYQAKQIILGENDYNVGDVAGKVYSDSRVNAFKALSYVQDNGVDAYQPESRSIASEGASAGGGCGLVTKVMRDSQNGDGGQGLFGRALLMLIVLSPFALAAVLKQRRSDLANRRAHQRYNISSEVRINFGDKELIGNVSTISLGGVKIDTEALLENGGVIEMNISSPDGKEKIQVMGKVVWSAERKSYGVQFSELANAQSSTINQWTQKLIKSS